jgi:hypothetical protein
MVLVSSSEPFVLKISYEDDSTSYSVEPQEEHDWLVQWLKW